MNEKYLSQKPEYWDRIEIEADIIKYIGEIIKRNNINIPVGPRFFGALHSNIINVYLPYTINSIYIPSTTDTIKDIYLAANTSTVKITAAELAQGANVINIHKSESTEVLLTGYTSTVNIITDGGV